jgi:putative transposase
MKGTTKMRHRRSVRLRGYDYAQPGAYFVTISTRNRMLFFDDEEIRNIAERCWLQIPDHFPAVELDEWVIMPNHLHGIIVIGRGVQLNAPTGGTARNPEDPFSAMSPRPHSLAVVIRTYKAAVTTLCRRAGIAEFCWQRNYYEHIIRDEGELNDTRQYIIDNPIRWATDEENPNKEAR